MRGGKERGGVSGRDPDSAESVNREWALAGRKTSDRTPSEKLEQMRIPGG